MPQKRNEPEPEVMTRGKSMPVIIAAGIFDAARLFFTFFWFLGPALAALYCTAKTSASLSAWMLGIAGTKTAAVLCSLGAGAVGAAGSEITIPFGIIMADSVGLVGFLALGLWIVMTNMRLLKAVKNAPLQFAAAFAVGEIPLIGSFPVFSFTLWRLYSAQIRVETAAHEKWEKEQADAQLRERNQQAARLAQIQMARVADAEQQAANDEEYAQAANDEKYDAEEIPERVPRAA